MASEDMDSKKGAETPKSYQDVEINKLAVYQRDHQLKKTSFGALKQEAAKKKALMQHVLKL